MKVPIVIITLGAAGAPILDVIRSDGALGKGE
jgi:hypothetical protein